MNTCVHGDLTGIPFSVFPANTQLLILIHHDPDQDKGVTNKEKMNDFC